MADKKYVVKTQMKHDGKRYGPGAAIALSDDQAASLLAAGAIEDPSAKPDEKDKPKK